jgi:histidyl-tRNA synthetase
MPTPIQPRTLKGFRDYLPQVMLAREQIIETARRVFRSFGFSPIDTPALEYLEILLGKGGLETDKQLYRFQDHGGRDVGMRFDLTVPLARFAAQHIGELGTPFKRYHIATVWRGENTQAGRYREFMQCDFDTIGTKGAAADAEVILVIHDLFRAIGIKRFTIRVNNRLILNGLLDTLGLQNNSAAILRALDKLSKVGRDQVAQELKRSAITNETSPELFDAVERFVSKELPNWPQLYTWFQEIPARAVKAYAAEQTLKQGAIDFGRLKSFKDIEIANFIKAIENAPQLLDALHDATKASNDRLENKIGAIIDAAEKVDKILEFVQLAGSNDSILAQMSRLIGNNKLGQQGIEHLQELLHAVDCGGVSSEHIKLDVSIARGLDYYTGTVIETTLDDLPAIGSVCSGGRYDNLAELYTKQQLPGIGASLGLDRLLAAMEELGMLPTAETPTQVLIPYFDAAHLGDYFQLAAVLRTAGLATEVYPEPTKLGKQLQYADRKGIRVAVIAGQREFDASECQVKNLSTGESTTASLADNAAELVKEAQRILAT